MAKAGILGALLSSKALVRAARTASDWVDLEWSLVVSSLARLAPSASGRLLDVGCGDKPYEQMFRPHVTEYIGIEYDASFGTTAASRRGKADVLYDGRRLPFDDASFDTVLSVQVLEHTPRPAELVAEMARVLRADGRLILSAPFSFRLHEEPNDFFRFSPHGLRELCGRAGLEIVELHPHGSLWSLIGHKLNSFLALEVARAGAMAQSLGKLGHENEVSANGARLWTVPIVAPMMIAVATCARLLDRAIPDKTETLGFTVVAKKAIATDSR